MKTLAPNKLIVCIVVGVILCVVGYLLGGETSITIDRTGPRVVDDTPRELVLTEPLSFKNLDISTSKADIRIERGSEFRLEAHYVDGSTPKYELAGDTLRFSDTGVTEQSMHFNIGYLSKTNYVHITLPQDAAPDLINITASLGSLTLRDVDAPTLTINSAMGDMRLIGTFAGTTDLVNSYGDISLDGSLMGTTSIKTGEGDLTMNGTADGKTDITASNGNVTLKGGASGDTSIHLAAGDLHMSGAFSGKTDISASFGNVTMDGEIAGETVIDSRTGDIRLKTTLPRERYKIDAQTDIGDLRISPRMENLPTAENTLQLRNRMGNIVVECANK